MPQPNRPVFVGLDPGPKAYSSKRGTMSTLDDWCQRMHVTQYSFFNIREDKGVPIDWMWVATTALQSEIHVALGNEASAALTALKVPHFKLPHPSGLNRKLNDKAYVDRVLRDCATYIRSLE